MCLAISLIPVGIIGGMEGLQYSSLLIILIFGVTFIVSLVISFFITQPIVKLTKNIDEISKGKLDVKLDKSEIHEINNLTDSLDRIMASLKLAIHKVGVKKGEIFDDAVKATQAVEKKHEDFLDSITGWAWEIDEKLTYTYCSNNISKILGYESDEVIGQSIFNFMLPEDIQNAEKIFKEASSKNKSIKSYINWHVCKNGKKICIITNGIPFFDENGNLTGFRGVDIDVTLEKESEAKIKQLKTELSNLKMEMTGLLNERDTKKIKKIDKHQKPISNNKDVIWTEHEFDSVFILDENANILDCNENMFKRLGYTKSEILNLNMADFDALESKDDIINKINKAKKEGSISFKSIHKRKDGSALLVFENLQYLKDENKFKCIVREDYSVKKTK